MPVIRRETLNEKPDWLEASAFGMFRQDILGFFLEAELEGQRRRGHLHREEHGRPVPQRRPAGQAAG